jgi:UV DNA damage endonuclease
MRYNATNGILLFRISSDLVRLHRARFRRFPGKKHLHRIATIGAFIRGNGLRVSCIRAVYRSFFPQRTNAENARKELQYHADLLDCMGLDSTHKIILHLGGAYGDKKKPSHALRNGSIIGRFDKNRLTLENDEKLYAIDDVLQAADQCGIPAVLMFAPHNQSAQEFGFRSVRLDPAMRRNVE